MNSLPTLVGLACAVGVGMLVHSLYSPYSILEGGFRVGSVDPNAWAALGLTAYQTKNFSVTEESTFWGWLQSPGPTSMRRRR